MKLSVYWDSRLIWANAARCALSSWVFVFNLLQTTPTALIENALERSGDNQIVTDIQNCAQTVPSHPLIYITPPAESYKGEAESFKKF